MKTYKEFMYIIEGGHRIPHMENMTPQEFRAYFKIGLGRKADVRPAHWNRAVEVMNVAQNLGFVKPQDMGRGNGKYVTMDKTKTHDQIADLVYKSKENWLK
jgi:hypothetical protein